MNALLRIAAWTLALALVVLPVVAVLNGWVGAGHWPLSRLRVTGEFRRVDGAVLRATLLPYAQRGFFAVDLDAAQDAVERLPWVETAEVRKRWPDVLEVRVTEHRPFARWGEDRLLSEQGRLFSANGVQVPAGLPRFDGPETRSAEVVALFNDTHARFGPLGLRVEGIALDPRGSWELQLGNGARVIVGRSAARARIDRFARLLPQLLADETQRLVQADLRYTNGFALVWADAQKSGTGTMNGSREQGSDGVPQPVDRASSTTAVAPQLPRSPFPVPALPLETA